jgi:uncharacterized protein YukE
MITYIDTTEVESIANELQMLAGDLDAEFDALFSRFEKVPTVSKEWVGGQANFYFQKISQDKQQYKDMAEAIRQLGSELKNEIKDFEIATQNNNKDK